MRLRMGRRWRWGRGRRHQPLPEAGDGTESSPAQIRTLAGVEPGCEVSVTGYLGTCAGQRRHLQAYGLLPGRRIRVLSQHPVTIVQIEQTELAFETAVAACVLVGD